MTLRDYQLRAIADARVQFASGRRAVCLVAPTGSGKTTIGAAIVRGHLEVSARHRVLWLAHRTELVDQAAVRLESLDIGVGVVAAGSARVADVTARVQVASIGTLLARETLPAATLVVFDEAHHYVATEWSRLARRYEGALRIGLTATPERGDGTALGALFDGMVSVASVRELTEQGYLAPCEVIAPDRTLAARTIAQDPVAAYLEHAPGERAIVFASHAKAAVQYATAFRGAGIQCATILDTTPASVRAEALEGHRDGVIPVLVNVFVLTEGFDSPSTSVCILARGCGAAGTYLQMVGRVLRVADGKRRALLLDLKGVSHVHGLPDDDREYSLEGRGIRRAAEAMVVGRFCLVCGALLEESGACVDCGRQYSELEAPRVVGAPLKRLARDALMGDSPAVRRARLERWREEGRRRGYRPGWAEQKYRGCYGSGGR
jgi:DNA repair protein RadD